MNENAVVTVSLSSSNIWETFSVKSEKKLGCAGGNGSLIFKTTGILFISSSFHLKMLVSRLFHNFNKNAVCLPLRFLSSKLLASSRFYSKNLENPISPHKSLKPYKTLKPYDVLNMLRFQKKPETALQIFMSAAQKPEFKHLRSSYDVLVDKLAKSNKYDVIENFLEGLKRGKSIGGTLVAVIRLYGRARMPQNALKTFFQMQDFNCRGNKQGLQDSVGDVTQEMCS
jgi:pentatricopeptide repeat protein